MPRILQILGTAPNIILTPSTRPEGVQRWCANNPRIYRKKSFPAAYETATHWFNLHSLRHIMASYPKAIQLYRDFGTPVILQAPHPDIPSSEAFPRTTLQQHFAINGKPCNYFTCSIAWQVALALYLGFDRIELWGFELKRYSPYDTHRPCLSYWLDRAQHSGIDIFASPDLEGHPLDLGLAGDPTSYTGPIYGYETT
jgi:hypothetical protein